MDEFIEIGRITAPHGVRGELRAQSFGNTSDSLAEFDYAYLGPAKKRVEFLEARPHKNIVILRLEDVTSIEAAEALRGQYLYMKRAELPALDEGGFYHADLLGMMAVLEDGTELGPVKEVLQTGANDVLILGEKGQKERLVPFIPDCIKEVSVESRRIVVTPLPGLFDEEDAQCDSM